MGTWASLVLLKTAEYPPVLTHYRDDLNDTATLSQSWRLLSFEGAELAQQATAFAPAVATWSGSPVLIMMVIDSDVLLIFAAHGTQQWEAVVPPPRDPDMARAGLTGSPAAEALLAWAADAGLDADSDAVTHVATKQHDEPFGASTALDGLLKAFNLVPNN
jgi:hypothetical protein